MRVKKFTGKSMQEAVENLRRDFGSDAVILHTAQKRRWFFGRLGPKRYEVTGAIDPNFQRPTANDRPKVQRPPQQQVTPRAAGPGGVESSGMDPLWSESIQELYGKLIRCDIPKDLAQNLLKEALSQLPQEDWNDLDKVWNRLHSAIAGRITTVDPWEFDGEQRVVVLIGPTGVGKTTTIAKLAANFALVADRKVGVVTMDTYRIAAVEQLKTYADIIGLPVQVAYSPRELKEAIARMKDRELVLIDTAGRSQNNHLQIAELRNYLEGITAEIHLVISATTKMRDIDEIVRVFGQLPIDRVIVTKLDETTAHGVILHTCERAKAPLAFVTTGQGVPEDIEVASGEKIAQLVLGGLVGDKL